MTNSKLNKKQELYTIPELAEILSVSYEWIDRRARKGGDGGINYVCLGRKRMVTREEIERIKKEGVR